MQGDKNDRAQEQGGKICQDILCPGLDVDAFQAGELSQDQVPEQKPDDADDRRAGGLDDDLVGRSEKGIDTKTKQDRNDVCQCQEGAVDQDRQDFHVLPHIITQTSSSMGEINILY